MRELAQMLYTNWPSTGNSFEGAFGGYDDASLFGNNSNYNSEDTIGDDYGVCVNGCVFCARDLTANEQEPFCRAS